MNVRERLMMDLYDIIASGNLYKETNKAFNECADFWVNKLDNEASDKAIAYLCDIDQEAFYRGARAVCDVIAGKDVY